MLMNKRRLGQQTSPFLPSFAPTHQCSTTVAPCWRMCKNIRKNEEEEEEEEEEENYASIYIFGHDPESQKEDYKCLMAMIARV